MTNSTERLEKSEIAEVVFENAMSQLALALKLQKEVMEYDGEIAQGLSGFDFIDQHYDIVSDLGILIDEMRNSR